ncbi:MAG: 5-oxoprolinase subunit PxpB [Thermodesulfobacteriota bacterium]
MYATAKFRIAGDCGLLVEYGGSIAHEVNQKVRSMTLALKGNAPGGVREVVPSYCSILVVYDPVKTNPHALKKGLTTLEQQLPEIEIPPPRVFEIPVCYGGEYGPDIDVVARTNQLTPEQVAQTHASVEYLIHMVGFSPGFPFLGGLPEILHTPRLATPRTSVPRGSVGIANDQTGIYPVSSPGGWQLIGRTPLRLFIPEQAPPIRYRSGDRIRFKPISASAYEKLRQEEAT